MPPMDVQGANPMSMCQMSPTFAGRVVGTLFFFADRIDAVDPGSNLGLISDSTWSVMLVRFLRFLSRVSGWRYPIDCSSDSRVIEMTLGKAALTLLEDEGIIVEDGDVRVMSLVSGNGGWVILRDRVVESSVAVLGS